MIPINKKTSLILAVFLMMSCLTINAIASDTVLRVGINPFSPMAVLTPNGPSGFSVDIWQALARRLGVDFEYVACEDVGDKLKRLREGSIDIAIGGITITEQREADFDFSYPVYQTGLDIMIPTTEKTTLLGLLPALFRGRKAIFFAGLLILVVIGGHAIWIVERSSKKKATSFHQNYVPGVFEGMYWALITASTIGYGDKVPQRWIGRTLTAVIVIIFMPLFGFFIAQLSSDLTLQSLKNSINGPEDLRGRRIAVVDGTASFDYMKNEHAYLDVFQRVDEAIDALLKGEVEAVVSDAPTLLYYANREGRGRVEVVGKIFEPQSYGLALPQGSLLREKINLAILGLQQSSEFKNIRLKWFGPQAGR